MDNQVHDKAAKIIQVKYETSTFWADDIEGEKITFYYPLLRVLNPIYSFNEEKDKFYFAWLLDITGLWAPSKNYHINEPLIERILLNFYCLLWLFLDSANTTKAHSIQFPFLKPSKTEVCTFPSSS